jgi:hypothetical protein
MPVDHRSRRTLCWAMVRGISARPSTPDEPAAERGCRTISDSRTRTQR